MQASYRAGVDDFRGELSVPSGPLPAGRHSLTREVVLASQRGRLLDAMAQAVADHGYGGTTVAHVVALAGVSRKTFYEHFADKQDCFLALYDTGIAYVRRRIADTLRDETPDGDPRERVTVGLRAFLDVLSEEPAFTRAIVVEVNAAGPEALRRRRAALEAFAQSYRDLNAEARSEEPGVPRLSQDLAFALVGAILELISARVEDGRTGELGRLTKPLASFVLTHVAPTERAAAQR